MLWDDITNDDDNDDCSTKKNNNEIYYLHFPNDAMNDGGLVFFLEIVTAQSEEAPFHQ